MLKQPTRIFQITDKQVYPDYISFCLNKEKRIICANKIPFVGYKVGDFVGISLDTTGEFSI